MELLPLARLIWRRKLPLAIGLVLAVALAVAIGGPPPSVSGLAWTRLALDTPKSQLVEPAPSGADTLAWRAALLAHLLATDETQRELAQRLHVRTDAVTVVDPAFALPEIPASMPSLVSETAATTGAPYILTVLIENPLLPIITLEAAAPNLAGAKRLADAGADILEGRSSRSGAKYSSIVLTGGGAALRPQPFSVGRVAPTRVKPVSGPAVPVKAIAAALCILGLWSIAVLLLPGRVSRRRPRVLAARA